MADTNSVPFPQGFVGTRGSNIGQANDILNFATLGVSQAYFIQTSDSASFGGTQGNDLSGTLRLVFSSGQTIDIGGAINWRITQGSTLHYFGFIPAPNVVTHVITYGNNQQYTLNAGSSYGLRKIGSPLAFADGADVSGNAALSGLLDQLNIYLVTVRGNGPQITGPSGPAGTASSATTVDEDHTAVATLTADKTVTWSIFGGADGGQFVIGAATGALAFVAAPDFEMPTDGGANNTYLVTVQATDSSGYTSQQTVTVTIADLDDTSPVIAGPMAVSVPGGQTAVAGFAADESVSWSLGGPDAAAFVVDAAGTVQFAAAADHEAPADDDQDNVYNITLTATDGAGNTGTQPLRVTVTEAPPDDIERPVITGASGGTAEVPEGQTAVATLTADETVTWSVSSQDAALFEIDPDTGVLVFASAPNHAAPADTDGDNIYLIIVEATDTAGNIGQQAISVTVTQLPPDDVTPPVISGPVAGTVDVVEGQMAVASLSANEPVTWAIDGGSDAALFFIDATGVLSFANPPMHASPGDSDADNAYLVSIASTDMAGNRSVTALTVMVAPMGQPDVTAPVISGPAEGLVEVPGGQTTVVTLTANEPVIWTISGGADASAFAISQDTGTLSFNQAPDADAPHDTNADGSYVVTVSATDAAGNISQLVLTVTVADEAPGDTATPVITGPSGTSASQTVSIPHGQTQVADFAADETVLWSMTGPHAALFALDPVTGTLTLVGTPPEAGSGDHVYVVSITATDTAGNTSTVLVEITVLGTPETVGEVFADHSDALVEIVRQIEIQHLRSSVASLRRLSASARDRFIAALQHTDHCRTLDDGRIGGSPDQLDADCVSSEGSEDMPFAMAATLQHGEDGYIGTGSFFGQKGSDDGRRRLIFGEFSILGEGAGVKTTSITAHLAWERSLSDHVMLGYFVGGSFARTNVASGLAGAAEKVSLSMGAYFVAEVDSNLYVDGFLAAEASRNMLTLRNDEISITGPYSARSMLAGLALSGVIQGGGFELRPKISLGYGTTWIGSVNLVATTPEMSAQVTALIKAVSYASVRITPELRIPVYDDLTSAHYIIAPSLVCDWTNGNRDCGAGLQLGLQGVSPDQMTRFDITLDADRVGETTAVSLHANVLLRF